jgi:hypothetical protein
MTPEQRDKLQDDYVHQCVDSMDLDTLYTFAYDSISCDLDDHSNNELVELVKQDYPELLNDT